MKWEDNFYKYCTQTIIELKNFSKTLKDLKNNCEIFLNKKQNRYSYWECIACPEKCYFIFGKSHCLKCYNNSPEFKCISKKEFFEKINKL